MSRSRRKPVSTQHRLPFQRGESRPTLLKDIDTGSSGTILESVNSTTRSRQRRRCPRLVVLVGGEPGIGANRRFCCRCARKYFKNAHVLYVSGRGIAQADQNSTRRVCTFFFTSCTSPPRSTWGRSSTKPKLLGKRDILIDELYQTVL